MVWLFLDLLLENVVGQNPILALHCPIEVRLGGNNTAPSVTKIMCDVKFSVQVRSKGCCTCYASKNRYLLKSVFSEHETEAHSIWGSGSQAISRLSSGVCAQTGTTRYHFLIRGTLSAPLLERQWSNA